MFSQKNSEKVRNLKRILEISGGSFLVLTGGLLGFVPFLPGFPLVIFGLVLISPHHGKKFLFCLKKSFAAAKRKEFKKAWRELLQFFPQKARWQKLMKKIRRRKKFFRR